MAEKKISKERVKAEKPKAGEKKVAGGTRANYDPWNILTYPSMSEKSIRLIESENKIVFVVRQNASKDQIKKAFETAFAVKVAGISTLLDQRSRKKAFIRISKEFLASDIATRLGIL